MFKQLFGRKSKPVHQSLEDSNEEYLRALKKVTSGMDAAQAFSQSARKLTLQQYQNLVGAQTDREQAGMWWD